MAPPISIRHVLVAALRDVTPLLEAPLSVWFGEDTTIVIWMPSVLTDNTDRSQDPEASEDTIAALRDLTVFLRLPQILTEAFLDANFGKWDVWIHHQLPFEPVPHPRNWSSDPSYSLRPFLYDDIQTRTVLIFTLDVGPWVARQIPVDNPTRRLITI
jgi:hypothetical protein